MPLVGRHGRVGFRSSLLAVKTHHNGASAERERGILLAIGPHARIVAVTPRPLGDPLEIHLERATLDALDFAMSGVATVAALRHVLTGAAEGLGHMHRIGIVHADVKPENVLIHDDTAAPFGMRVTLCDFASSVVLPRCRSAAAHLIPDCEDLGTHEYGAPEVLASGCRGSLTPMSDCFSLGVTVCVVLCGRRPWVEATDFDVGFADFDGLSFASAWRDCGGVGVYELNIADRVAQLCRRRPASRLSALQVSSLLPVSEDAVLPKPLPGVAAG